MNRRWFAVLPLLLFAVAVFAAPPAYKVEKTGACASAELSDAMKSMLQPEGYRLAGDSGPVCEVWLRKILPMKSGSSAPEYGALNPGDFVGVIQYARVMGDYRGQSLKAGTYTMRYQTMPADGNHMGVSPTQEYVLLAPASLDKDPAATVEYDALLDLSRKVSGTTHPTPLYLVAPATGGNASFRDAGEGRWTLEIKTKGLATGGAEVDFPLALVLIGKGES